jgi:uncharacterized membrane protein YvbJ
MAYCTTCGKANPDTAKFCTSCGGPLSTSSAKESKATKKGKKWILLSVILTSGLLVALYFILFTNQGKKNQIMMLSEEKKSAIRELVNTWNTGLNNANTITVTSLYAERLIYYRQSLSKENAAVILNDFFQKNPYFTQQITSEITIDKSSESLVVASFDKTVTMNGKTTVYPSYLKFSEEDNNWKIVEEGDKITDYNINKKR